MTLRSSESVAPILSAKPEWWATYERLQASRGQVLQTVAGGMLTACYLGALSCEADMTITEVGMPRTLVAPDLVNIAKAYMDRLAGKWPHVEVYREEQQENPDALRLLVVAPTWDFELEKAAYELMWIQEAEDAGLFLDVAVYFKDRCLPDSAGFRLVR